jgi:hypothetical protein
VVTTLGNSQPARAIQRLVTRVFLFPLEPGTGPAEGLYSRECAYRGSSSGG